MHTHEMISTHPDVKGSVNDALIRCIEECYACAQTCVSCADACLAEDSVDELKQCIRLNVDCADVCAATAKLASRRTGSNQDLLRQMIETCASACRICGEECARHADMHEHCQICADSCRSCEEACRQAVGTVH
ncbi:MAG: four-helix bundle copper-binding protein [Rhodospirillales bacterium]|nr:four-helix bundle copper-binding protein [Rhodospirillales bacterium]